jgi:two-component system sensor histidine kinase PhoQ
VPVEFEVTQPVRVLVGYFQNERDLWLPEQLLEARLNQPESGLYAMVIDATGAQLWRSPSAVTTHLREAAQDMPLLSTGERAFSRLAGFFRFSYQVLWQTEAGQDIPLMFSVLETAEPLDAAVGTYRRSLVFWLGGSAVLLLACQAGILAWGLRPLDKLSRDLARIEDGETDRLEGVYPRELQGITDNLNTLLNTEQDRRSRVRNTLSDLAHSLKTPLAVIRGAGEQDPGYRELVKEQTGRMEQIVSYQLQRSSGGSHKLLQVIEVDAVAQRLRHSLHKVYADQLLDIDLHVEAGCVFRGDERDLLEVLGNLMDNACKYGKRQVRLSARGGGRQALRLTIEDDGAGISPEMTELITERGIRADSQRAGQGIGLAVVADIVSSYGGELSIHDSELGGARIEVRLP